MVQSLSVDRLITECHYAGVYSLTDQCGSKLLLAEVERRVKAGELDGALGVDLVYLLEWASSRRIVDIFSDPDKQAEQVLARLKTLSDDEYLYHGTLRSRLVGIMRDGLIPGKRPKNWGTEAVNIHASKGVYFTDDWRGAANWVGFSAYVDDRPLKGCIIRIPRSGHHVEKDRLASAPGCLLVPEDRVSTDDASVLFFPFSVDNTWLHIQEAVEVDRAAKKKTRVTSAK